MHLYDLRRWRLLDVVELLLEVLRSYIGEVLMLHESKALVGALVHVFL
jgi:hypothetical protein